MMAGVAGTEVTFSTSTWQQPIPAPAGAARVAVLERIVDLVVDLGDGRLRIVVDGRTAAGKTSIGHELALGIAARGRPAFRASLDDFKRPWSEAHRYDRVTGEGYYRNAFDFDSVRRLLLDPAAPSGTGVVALCSIDPITQQDHSNQTVVMPEDGVLVMDGVFGCRPELGDVWDLRIWVEIDPERSVRRGIARDADREGGPEAAEALHRGRYLAAEVLYLEEVDPVSFVEVVIDNSDFELPRLLRVQD